MGKDAVGWTHDIVHRRAPGLGSSYEYNQLFVQAIGDILILGKH